LQIGDARHADDADDELHPRIAERRARGLIRIRVHELSLLLSRRRSTILWIAHADRYHGNNKLLMGGAQRPMAVLDVADLICPP
jgi:hypothetical protein